MAQKYAWTIMNNFDDKNFELALYGVVGQWKVTKWRAVGGFRKDDKTGSRKMPYIGQKLELDLQFFKMEALFKLHPMEAPRYQNSLFLGPEKQSESTVKCRNSIPLFSGHRSQPWNIARPNFLFLDEIGRILSPDVWLQKCCRYAAWSSWFWG